MNNDPFKKKLDGDIDKLSKNNKKALYEKFVEHGGQVVDKKKKSPSIKNFNRDKQKELLKKQQAKKEELKKKYSSKKTEKKGTTKTSKLSQPKKANPYEGQGKFALYFSSVFNRVRSFSGSMLAPPFEKMLKTGAQNKFLDLNLVITTIIHSKSMNQGSLKKDLILKYPLFYELLVRLDKLYDEKIFIEINSKFSKHSKRNLSFYDLRDQLKAIFKKLYILQPHRAACIEAIGTSFGIMNKNEKISRGAISENVSKARASINYLFGMFFDKLFLAFLNSIKSNIPINDPVIPKILDIKEEDYVGYLVKKIKDELKKRQEQKDTKETKEEAVEEEEEALEDLADDVRDGMQLINQINYSKTNISKDNPAFYFDQKDKIYHIYKILDEFEKEYSFVLTSNKIRYAVDYQQGGRLDPKKDFNELYVQLNSIHDGIREYIAIVKETFEIENKPGVPMMQKHNQLHNLSIRQSKLNMDIRIKLLDIIKKMTKLTEEVFNKSQLVVQNPSEQLSFDNSLEGKKKLDNKTPIESLQITLSFLKAFSIKLHKGDLGGAGIKMG